MKKLFLLIILGVGLVSYGMDKPKETTECYENIHKVFKQHLIL